MSSATVTLIARLWNKYRSEGDEFKVVVDGSVYAFKILVRGNTANINLKISSSGQLENHQWNLTKWHGDWIITSGKGAFDQIMRVVLV